MSGILIILAALAGAGVGFRIAQGFRPGEVETGSAGADSEEGDDPTAPITPLVEIARSPHDRHRDLAIGNSLVKSIDLLDVVRRSGENQTRESLLDQLGLLRGDFQGLLESCSYVAFSYEAGTIVDGGARARIQIVGGHSGEGPTRITKTIRCGYLYEPGGGDEPVVIRKAEVEIG
ncbi:MAG: hypothetical protein KDN18_20135 [Verrucomicrobiae bacterium]|nr:hypothetical protein [Verrucomicrobiae bacterium]